MVAEGARLSAKIDIVRSDTATRMEAARHDDSLPTHKRFPREYRLHPRLQAAEEPCIEISDQTLEALVPINTTVYDELTAAGIHRVGLLGLLAMADYAAVDSPLEGLERAVWLRAVARLLVMSPVLRLTTGLAISDDAVEFTLKIVGSETQIHAVTRLRGQWIVSAIEAGITWASWWQSDLSSAAEGSCRIGGRLSASFAAARAAEERDKTEHLAIIASAQRTPLPQLIATFKEDVEKWLKPRDALVLLARLGLRNGSVPTLGEIGEELGLTRERIRQLESKATLHTNRRSVPAVGELAAGIELLYTPYIGCHETVATMLLQISGDLAHDAARSVVRFMHGRLATPGSRKAPEKISTADLPALLRNVEALLDEANGKMPIDELAAAVAEQPWAASYPYALIDRLADVLIAAEVADLCEGVVRLRDNGRAEPAERRIQRLVDILAAHGRALHFTDLCMTYNNLPTTTRPIAKGTLVNLLSQFPETFAICGPGTYGLTTWDIGLSMPRAELQALGLAPARRTGASDEIAAFLFRSGQPIPLAEIEAHVLQRFEINSGSIYAALQMDAAGRFVQDAAGNWGLRRWLDPNAAATVMHGRPVPEMQMPAPRAVEGRYDGTLLSTEEHDRLTERALAWLAEIEQRLARGLPGVSAGERLQYAILSAVAGHRKDLQRILQTLGAEDAREIPITAVRAVVSLVR